MLKSLLTVSLLVLIVTSCGDTASEPTPVNVALARTSIPEALRIVDLGPLQWAHGINAPGQIVGISPVGDPEGRRAVLWEKGEWTNLGIVAGGTNSHATAINARGQIIGRLDRGRPVLWTR